MTAPIVVTKRRQSSYSWMLSRRARDAAKESHSNAANPHPLTTQNASDTLKGFTAKVFTRRTQPSMATVSEKTTYRELNG
jgi:hypothetical protein